jgi:hypothetical protein
MTRTYVLEKYSFRKLERRRDDKVGHRRGSLSDSLGTIPSYFNTFKQTIQLIRWEKENQLDKVESKGDKGKFEQGVHAAVA